MATLPLLSRVSRRALLLTTMATVGTGLLSACAPQGAWRQPAPRLSQPSRPEPAEAAKPAVAPATSAPVGAPPASTQPAAPTSSAAKPIAPTPAPGCQATGARESSDWQARRADDPARGQAPPKLGEAPMLAELVKAGKLPPVEQRVPDEPMVIKPLIEIGKYGGTWRRASPGPATARTATGSCRATSWSSGTTPAPKQMPSVGEELGDRRRRPDDHLLAAQGPQVVGRRTRSPPTTSCSGSRTLQNKDLTPTPTAEMSINGKPGTIEKVDDLTVRFRFPEPYPTFMDIIGGSTYIGVVAGSERRRRPRCVGRSRRSTT